MLDNFRLDGQVAVVTGGGRGIGRGIALGLAECGADVVVIARRQADVDAVAAEIRERGRRSLALSADVLNWDAIPAALDRVVAEFGQLDIMVNNAGGNLDRKMYALPDISMAKFDEQLSLNMKTKWWGAQQAAARMRDGGSIISIISIAAHKPSPGFGVYSAANLGMISMTRTLAVELAPRRITVNCIAPGIIVTDMLKETMHLSEDQAKAAFDKVIPLGRTGTPEDCAAAACFFASPAARWVTGQFIDVAGGQPT
ncbi:MAG: glucose 1-dehydrogenase [Pseudomonadales bacterium]|nr:glucose 1-dehydrogenase [Pseudomonadales bacterium]